jgi:hypothetical protein
VHAADGIALHIESVNCNPVPDLISRGTIYGSRSNMYFMTPLSQPLGDLTDKLRDT